MLWVEGAALNVECCRVRPIFVPLAAAFKTIDRGGGGSVGPVPSNGCALQTPDRELALRLRRQRIISPCCAT